MWSIKAPQRRRYRERIGTKLGGVRVASPIPYLPDNQDIPYPPDSPDLQGDEEGCEEEDFLDKLDCELALGKVMYGEK